MFKKTPDGMDYGSTQNCQKDCNVARGEPARRYTDDHEAAKESQMLCQLGKKGGKHGSGHINRICFSGFLSNMPDHENAEHALLDPGVACLYQRAGNFV